jgi:hypothetical protein
VHSQSLHIAKPKNLRIVIAQYDAIPNLQHWNERMKKHREADELAARLAAAANQPPKTFPAPVEPELAAPAPNGTPQRSPKERKEAKSPEIDTVPISLRPERALLNKYILKAAERTREAGRVVSAQQIMLEILERGAV